MWICKYITFSPLNTKWAIHFVCFGLLVCFWRCYGAVNFCIVHACTRSLSLSLCDRNICILHLDNLTFFSSTFLLVTEYTVCGKSVHTNGRLGRFIVARQKQTKESDNVRHGPLLPAGNGPGDRYFWSKWWGKRNDLISSRLLQILLSFTFV